MRAGVIIPTCTYPTNICAVYHSSKIVKYYRKRTKDEELLQTILKKFQMVDASKHDKLVRQLYNENAELAKRLVYIEKKSKQDLDERSRQDEKHKALLKVFRQVCVAATAQ